MSFLHVQRAKASTCCHAVQKGGVCACLIHAPEAEGDAAGVYGLASFIYSFAVSFYLCTDLLICFYSFTYIFDSIIVYSFVFIHLHCFHFDLSFCFVLFV